MKTLLIGTILLSVSLPAATRSWQPGETSQREGSNRISASSSHTCAALYDGSVRCWGSNEIGELGNGTTTNSSVPVVVDGLKSVTAVATGQNFSCALASDYSLRCWGRNNAGQLGIGSTAGQNPFPQQVVAPDKFVQIAAGGNHACALSIDGRVFCWGLNLFGQAAGSGVFSNVPVLVSRLSKVIQITAGANHTCALLVDATVSCWGRNSEGQLGLGNTTTGPSSPASITGLADVTAVAAGGNHTCATLVAGAMRCWGANSSGQLGTGDTDPRLSPAPVVFASLPNASSIEAGASHTCATTAAGLVKCWGSNSDGQSGAGGLVPTEVAGVTMAAAVSAGGAHSCALRANGTIFCWGRGADGQLGNGATTGTAAPVAVSNIAGSVSAKAIAAGGDFTCAVRSNGTVSCWGSNGFTGEGRLGNGPVTGNVPNPALVAGLTDAVSVTAGERHACALIANGTVRCWGGNSFGEIGNGTTINQPTPQTVPGLSDVVAVEAGGSHTCALLSTREMRCWGAARLGNGASAGSASPVVVLVDKVAAMGTGGGHTCVARVGGSVHCWGGSGNQQLGYPTTPNLFSLIPQVVPNIGEIVTISGGVAHNCATSASGAVFCWGSNQSGAVGNGQTGTDVMTPHQVAGIRTSVVAAGFNSCAGGDDDWCWGSNFNGINGNGLFAGSQPLPATVLSLSLPIQFSLSPGGIGGFHSCAVLASGSPRCWGKNNSGQLGTGSFADSAVPVVVPSFTLNIVPTVQLSSTNPRRLTVNIVSYCEVGERVQVRVDVAQGSVGGQGIETVGCAGYLTTFPVVVQAQGNTPFGTGAAVVSADAVIWKLGDREQQQWTRAVQIVP